MSTANTAGADAAAYARGRLAEIRRAVAEDREAFWNHPDVIACSTGRPVPADPEPAPLGATNFHPGPDFAPNASAA